MENNFLQLKDDSKTTNIFDDVEIVIDPELEDESTVDINNYLNKFILQCRICGNLFPSEEMLDNDSKCPICDSQSPDGFIFKGKLLKKNKEGDKEQELSPEKQNAIDDLTTNDSDIIPSNEDFDEYSKDDLSANMIDIEQ